MTVIGDVGAAQRAQEEEEMVIGILEKRQGAMLNEYFFESKYSGKLHCGKTHVNVYLNRCIYV